MTAARNPSATDQQREAIHARGVSVVLSSGAGCGKTTVLTARYLSHLTQDAAEIGSILAITFTERAAREMRDRIRRAVEAEVLTAANEARDRWQRHREALESAPINTFHAFCSNLLRRYFLEVGLGRNFEVLNEAQAANVRREVVRDGLQELLVEDSEVGADLRELTVLFGWPRTKAALAALLNEKDIAAWKQWLSRDPQEIADSWRAFRDQLRPDYCDFVLAATPQLSACLDLLKTVVPMTALAKHNVALILDWLPRLAEAPQLGQLQEQLKEAAKVQGKGRGKDAWPETEVYERVRDTFSNFRGVFWNLGLRPFMFSREDTGAEIETGRRCLRVALRLAEAYAAENRAKGQIDFSEMLTLTRQLLRDRPEIAAELQDRFAHILLDESQDTDPIQMEIINRICGDVGKQHGKLFAVGDHKQSIYRFRGADVELFQKLRQEVAEHGRLDLTANFRSQRPIVDFVNALCSRRIANYEPLVASIGGDHDPPRIEFLWSEGEGEGESATDNRAREAAAIARRIRTMIDDGECRVLENNQYRQVEAKDIVLLFRGMNNVSLYETALRDEGIDYYLVGGRAFYAQQEIFDLLNLFRALENPDDQIALAGVCRSPFGGLSDESLYLLSIDRNQGLWRNLQDANVRGRLPEDQRPIAERLRANLQRWLALKDQLPTSRLMSEILRDSAYDAALQFEALGDRKLANLWKLQQIARSFDRRDFPLHDFIEHLSELTKSQPREEQAATQPEQANVVKLMTIHQAKGLEFPVVFLPDFAAQTRGGFLESARWHPELGCLVRAPSEEELPPFTDFGWQLGRAADQLADWREEMRILYVGCTRARDMLILAAGFSKEIDSGVGGRFPQWVPENSGYRLAALAEQFNLLTGECRDVAIPPDRRPRVRVIRVRTDVESARRRQPAAPRPIRSPFEPVPGISLRTMPAVVSLPEVVDQILGDTAATRRTAIPFDRFPNARERLRGNGDSPRHRRERVFREVLARWDFHDPHGWQTPLQNLLDERFDPGEASMEQELLSERFWNFASSEARDLLMETADLHRDVEFLIDGSEVLKREAVLGYAAGETVPNVRGLIDFLWRDEADNWHLLGVECGDKDQAVANFPAYKQALAIQSYAARDTLGNRLKSVRFIDLSTEQLRHFEPRQLRFGPAFRWLFEAVRTAQST